MPSSRWDSIAPWQRKGHVGNDLLSESIETLSTEDVTTMPHFRWPDAAYDLPVHYAYPGVTLPHPPWDFDPLHAMIPFRMSNEIPNLMSLPTDYIADKSGGEPGDVYDQELPPYHTRLKQPARKRTVPRDKAPRDIAAQELAGTASPRRASARAGVSLEQVEEWLKDPTFLCDVMECRTTPFLKTVHLLTRCGTTAVKVLYKEMRRPGNKRSVARVRAATKVIELLEKLMHTKEVVERLNKMERLLVSKGMLDVEQMRALPEA